MVYPSQAEFIKLAKRGNLIPVVEEVAADMETPVSAFLKIQEDFSFLLESVEGGENIARYSFLGGKPFLVIKGNSLDELRRHLAKYKPVVLPNLPRFIGGAVGYLSYDMAKTFEHLPSTTINDLKLPGMEVMLVDTLLAFDHVQHKIQIISNAFVKGDPKKAYQAALRKIEHLAAKLKQRVKPVAAAKRPGRDIFKSNMSRREFEAMVVKAKKYIYAGDVFQVVLSQRFAQKYRGDPFTIYRAMRTVNPSPYMYFLQFGQALQLIGSSPELLVRRVGETATLRPIAGTRKRGKDKHEDEELGRELLADAKERAEHIMLVDLGRNDLGRVCEFGSVKVTESMVIERYSHVMHIVSNISGRLRPGIDGLDLLRATFPAGTVSGAPKIRAMEIIDELEKNDRGIYAGAVFYLGFNGDLDSCIAIRTMVVKDYVAYAQAGAGIVADSVPRKEYQESLNKCQAMFTSLNRAKGFKNGA